MDTLWNSTHSFAKVLESFMFLIRMIIKKFGICAKTYHM